MGPGFTSYQFLELFIVGDSDVLRSRLVRTKKFNLVLLGLVLSIDNVARGNVFFVHSCLFLSISDERKFLAAGLHSVLKDRSF